MSNIIPIRNGTSFREAFPIIAAPDVYAVLTNKLHENSLSFLSYQAPEKIASAYDMIGYAAIFEDVAAQWPGPNTSANDLKRTLANFVKRRNQIAHEGDREASGAVRHMQPQYASRCADFIETLVRKLNFVVYGV